MISTFSSISDADFDRVKTTYSKIFRGLRTLELEAMSEAETTVMICRKNNTVTIEIPVELVDREEQYMSAVIIKITPDLNGTNLGSSDAEVFVQDHHNLPHHAINHSMRTYGAKSFQRICDIALGKCANLRIADNN